ncbi:hypothetical protein D3C72_1997310 [compost metagenome]
MVDGAVTPCAAISAGIGRPSTASQKTSRSSFAPACRIELCSILDNCSSDFLTARWFLRDVSASFDLLFKGVNVDGRCMAPQLPKMIAM